MATDNFSVDEGEVLFQWPSNLSPESAQFILDWLAIRVRTFERIVQKEQSRRAAKD